MSRDQVYDPRRAGLVERYHAQIHVSHQTVAEHTWQVLRIVSTIWPEAPAEVFKYVVYHDIAEGVTGDVPYPVKLSDYKIKRLMDTAEEVAVKDMQEVWDIPVIPQLDTETRAVVKACEIVEMWEWALYEQNLGNSYARLVAERLIPRIKEAQFKDPELTARFRNYVTRREAYELGYQSNSK